MKEYEEYLTTFSTTGWKMFIERVKVFNTTQVNTMPDLESTDEMLIRKGFIHALTYIENFEQLVDYTLNQQEEESDADL